MLSVAVNQNNPDKTVIQFKAFGSVVYSESYPKYAAGTAQLNSAIRDAQRRFANRLSEVLKS